jgi:signal transduction histidine kinase
MSECVSQTSIGFACIASPIAGSDGELSAVLLAEIDLETESVDLLSLETLNDDFVITLMSGDGVVLASNEQSVDTHTIESTTASAPLTTGGMEAGSSIVPIDLVPGWTVSLQPREPFTSPLWADEAGWLLAVVLAASVLASIGAWITLRRMSRPMIAAPFASVGAPRALIQRQIDERQQLSNELGEDAAQSLAALAMMLGDLDSSNPQDMRGRLARASAVALQVMDDIRGLATRLHPPTLRHFGLEAALKSFVEKRFANGDVDVHVAAVGTRPERDQFVESVLFRVAQELIDDIYMRSDARAVLIIIEMSQKQLSLTIEDDGPSHHAVEVPSDTSQFSGIAIASVQQLVSSLGGTVAIQSEHRRGTRVLITLPLASDTNA